jgi:hypothetical protein
MISRTAFDRICRLIVFWLACLTLLGACNVIDFHVCIKPTGHCKIIDPTKEPMKSNFRLEYP